MIRSSPASHVTLVLMIVGITSSPRLASEGIDPARLTLERIFGEEAVDIQRFGIRN